MSKDELLAQYAAELQVRTAASQARVAAEQDEIASNGRLKLLEMQVRLLFGDDAPIASLTKQKSKRRTKQQRFIDEHRGLLELSDIEFLSVPERDTRAVAEHLVIHRNEVSKRLRAGHYSPGPHDSRGKRMVDTISVIEREVINVHG